ncbi:MAG: DUF3526 domain-containing protein [Gammaproteobacteria bacterium]|nr:DUF3526 domain-containing protein [Gammaproteobacteria bacterium]
MTRDRAFIASVAALLALSVLSVAIGLAEVRQQQTSISQLLEIDRSERNTVLSQQKSYGGAAYYTFHLTYDRPSDFAFAALGQRDNLPWKHRIRMLALEGQIYERDVGNPLLALIGRFDFTFLAAFIYPLVLILVLHDFKARERVAGRHDLLVATAGRASFFWLLRAGLRSTFSFIALVTPLVLAGLISGTTLETLSYAAGAVLVYTFAWAALCYWVGSWNRPVGTLLSALMGIWILLAVIIPASGREIIDRMIPLPSGANIVMTQREVVNAAWDLPKAQTMTKFLERHPEWKDDAAIERPFEWKWYYAFQQVGDQAAEPLSLAYRDGRLRRDKVAARVALFAPPAMLARIFQKLANTNVLAALEYEEQVRGFHAQLRTFFYPRLFSGEPFNPAVLEQLPQFGSDVAGATRRDMSKAYRQN